MRLSVLLGFSCIFALVACKSAADANAADGGSANAGNAGASAGHGNAGAASASDSGADAGHSGNTAGNSATTPDASDLLDDGGAAPCTPCVGKTIGWGPNGGFVAYTEHSELTQCNGYHHTRVASGRAPSQPMLECERPVPCMGSGLHGVADVLQALKQPDVVAARANAMVLYGLDSRPVDGSVFRIELPGSIIEVGNACGSGDNGCTAIPAGISALQALLRSVDTEQLALEPCLTMFKQ